MRLQGGALFVGDCRVSMSQMAAESVDCVVTSPPYWGLRDYGLAPVVWGGSFECHHQWGDELRVHKGGPSSSGALAGRSVMAAQDQLRDRKAGAFCSRCGAWLGCLGLEPTYPLFVDHMAEVFSHVWRVLKPSGTLWLNLGDTYATAAHSGLRPKSLAGIPWRVSLRLQDDGWILRSEIIWEKPQCLPESATDRPTRSHEQMFLLAKNERYHYDAAAICEPASPNTHSRGNGVNPKAASVGRESGSRQNASFSAAVSAVVETRNARTVWRIPSRPYPGAHFATFPPELAKRCILAGCPEGGTVLDPFMGSGTVAQVAVEQGRRWVGCEAQEQYAPLIQQRLAQGRLFAQEAY